MENAVSLTQARGFHDFTEEKHGIQTRQNVNRIQYYQPKVRVWPVKDRYPDLKNIEDVFDFKESQKSQVRITGIYLYTYIHIHMYSI